MDPNLDDLLAELENTDNSPVPVIDTQLRSRTRKSYSRKTVASETYSSADCAVASVNKQRITSTTNPNENLRNKRIRERNADADLHNLDPDKSHQLNNRVSLPTPLRNPFSTDKGTKTGQQAPPSVGQLSRSNVGM